MFLTRGEPELPKFLLKTLPEVVRFPVYSRTFQNKCVILCYSEGLDAALGPGLGSPRKEEDSCLRIGWLLI